MIKVCKKHGPTQFVKNGKTCGKCNVEQVMRAHTAHVTRALEYKGGKCAVCGYNKCKASLDFHHLNPEEKEANVGNLLRSSSWNRIKEELDKCILVCKNCHGEIHAGITSI